MSKKPSKPRVARASVVKKISDPLQSNDASAESSTRGRDKESAQPPGKTDEATEDEAPIRLESNEPASTAAAPDPAAAGQLPDESTKASEPSALEPVRRVQAKAIVPATPVEESPPPDATSADAASTPGPLPTSEPPATVPVSAPVSAAAITAGAAQTGTLQPVGGAAGDASNHSSQPPSQPPSPKIDLQQLLAPLATPIQPVESNPLYGVSAVLVAAAIMLLPLAYLLLVGAVLAASLIWLAAGVTSGVGFFVFHLLPSLFGLLFVFFLIKPFLAPPEWSSVKFSLDREREPRLFAFVEQVAKAVGAPPPVRIDVASDANASASFRQGMGSFFAGDDLVLTIGLPLAAAMNVRELTGVLAHEFGHFTQKSGMRLQFLIRYINYWFERVVAERDAWDARLDYWIDVLPGRLAAIPWLLKLCVFLSRLVLSLLLKAAAFLSSHFSRQMEFDADRHQLRLCGTDSFIQCEYELRFLGAAQSFAFQDIQQSWTEGRLSDDWPALVVANIDWFRRKPEAVDFIRKDVQEAKTAWWDTHPASAERIAMAQREAAGGQFHVQAPARLLFNDFGGLCKAVSLDFYRELIEEEITASNLVPAAQLYQEQVATIEARETLLRFFQGKVLGRHEIFLPDNTEQPVPEFAAGLRGVRSYREQMLLGLERLSTAVQRFSDADDRVRQLSIAVILQDCGFRFDPKAFELPSSKRAVILHHKEQAANERKRELQRLEEHLQDGRNRMVLALRLLHNPEMAARIDDIESLRQRTANFLAIMKSLEAIWPQVLRLREAYNMLGALLGICEEGDGGKEVIQQIERISNVCYDSLQFILNAMNAVSYPFSHAKGNISIAAFLLKESPDKTNPIEVLLASEQAVEQLVELYYRLFSQMAVAAETVESTIGLDPLPTPKDETQLTDEERAALEQQAIRF